ncbi:MAG: EF-hand domain-containing protein [Magnetococcales bacterium]|nr:EF-hand domain-containing protein [Magnetococcales bacterium]
MHNRNGTGTLLLLAATLLLANWPGEVLPQTMTERRTARFAALDRNQDGQLSGAELAQMPCAQANSGPCPMLVNLDSNHDGQISQNEFMKGLNGNGNPRCGNQGRGGGWQSGGGPGWGPGRGAGWQRGWGPGW